MSLQRILHLFARALQWLQVGLIAFCLYHIIDAYTAPYHSEWLTADALVPSLILAIIFYSFCFLATQRVAVFAKHRVASLLLIPNALFTMAPYAILMRELTSEMGT